MTGNGEDDTHRREDDQEIGPPEADEGQGHPRQRQCGHDATHVEESLSADENGAPDREIAPERITAAARDAERGHHEEDEERDDDGRPEQPELLSGDGEDHVRVGLG